MVGKHEFVRCPRCDRKMTEIVSVEDDDGFAQRQWSCPKGCVTTPLFQGDWLRCEIDAQYWVHHHPKRHA